MRLIDTQALRLVARALGVGNPVTAVGEVIFDDENLQQSLEVGPLIRRGASLAASQGLFWFSITNEHVGAGAIRSVRNPYNTSSAITASGYEVPLPAGLDAWLVGACGLVSPENGAANFTKGMCALSMINSEAGFADTTPGTLDLPVVVFDDVDTTFQNLYGDFLQVQTAHLGVCPLPVRLRSPTSRIVWHTVASGAGTYSLLGVVAVLPAGLGQDAAL